MKRASARSPRKNHSPLPRSHMDSIPEVERFRTSTPPAALSDAHRRTLEEESSISPAVVDGRGYWTATRRVQLEGLVRAYQRRVPALVLPTFSPDGETTSL